MPAASPGPPAGPTEVRDDDHGADLHVALHLADAADAITTGRFGAGDLRIASKADLTPVTDADQAVERQLRRILAEVRPGDGVLGEEYGASQGSGGPRQWVLDPVDGTKNFLRGVPVWATLIALRSGPATSVGVVSAPALGRRWWAATGVGAWVRAATGPAPGVARRLAVSSVASLDEASLSYSSLSGWAERGRLPRLLGLAERCWRTRAYGDFWSYVLLAEGAVDIACEPSVSVWDLAAPEILVREAGGRFTDLEGRPGPDGGSAVATNGALHPAVLAALAPSDGPGQTTRTTPLAGW